MIFRTPHFSLNTKTLQILDKEGKEVKVYNKDYELLKYLCEVNEAKSGLDILDNVWDRNGNFSSNVVASSVANIRRVLGKEALKTVRNCYMVEVLNPIAKPQEQQETVIVNNDAPFQKKFSKKTFFIISGIIFIIFLGTWTFFQKENSPIIVSEVQVNAQDNDNQNLQNEWIRIKNTSEKPISLKNWTISDEINHTFRFFEDRILAPNAELQIITGVCENTRTQVCWKRTDYAVWNNDHDTVFIRNEKNELVYKYNY